jgi:hypothetical protein
MLRFNAEPPPSLEPRSSRTLRRRRFTGDEQYCTSADHLHRPFGFQAEPVHFGTRRVCQDGRHSNTDTKAETATSGSSARGAGAWSHFRHRSRIARS